MPIVLAPALQDSDSCRQPMQQSYWSITTITAGIAFSFIFQLLGSTKKQEELINAASVSPSFFPPFPPSLPPPHQCDRQQDSEQGDVVQHEQELPADEGVDGPQWMLLVVLVPFDAEAVVVTEVHGEDVVCHVGHTVPDDKVGGQPVSGKEQTKYI